MRALPAELASRMHSGFTMVEVIVVLVLLGFATAVVVPSLFSSHSKSSELTSVVGSARGAAVRRGETILLRIDQSGAWQVVATAPTPSEILMSGQLGSAPANRVELVFSPLGTCGPPAESGPAVGLDPLTCEVLSP